MPGYTVASFDASPGALFSVQEKHLRDPVGPKDVDQVAIALDQPSTKKARVACRPTQMRRRILLDVMETPDVFEVKADMPGVGKQNIKVDIEGDVLTLSVAPQQQQPTNDYKATHTAGACPCGEKCACNPCKCAKTTAQAPTAPQQHDAVQGCGGDTNTACIAAQCTQHATFPCDDKCACNPCKCDGSSKGQLGDSISLESAEEVQNVPQPSMSTHHAQPQQPSAEALTKCVKHASAETDEEATPAARWHAAERTRRFQKRAIRIPPTADTTKVSANYTDGVLTVTVQKILVASRKKIVSIA